MKWYCGIDPGLSGAIAFYDGVCLLVYDFPLLSKENRLHKIRKRIDIARTADIFKNIANVDLVLLEEVHSMPSDGHVGAFSFGKTCGIIEGILGTLGIPVILTSPAVWKPTLGLNSTKAKSIALAKLKFPHHAHYFARAKDDGRAEAALLAWIAYEKFATKVQQK